MQNRNTWATHHLNEIKIRQIDVPYVQILKDHTFKHYDAKLKEINC